MRAEFVGQLRCPSCRREGALVLNAQSSDEREVREGLLRCSACASEFPVRRGVPELLHEAPEHVRLEAAGLERFAERMREDGWDRDMVLRLPDLELGYWYVQARSMHQLLTTVPFAAHETIVDVGSNTCWATNHFAQRGLRAIAIDIATAELQGLYTADWFIEGGETFFERVLGSMDALPLASNSVDYVYCCQVLHHNDPAGLRRTFEEIFRVLRPGGRLLVVNETLKTSRDPSGVHDENVEEFEGYEHAHWAWRYRWEAIRAGFMTSFTEPHYRPFFGDADPPGDASVAARLLFGLRRFSLIRRLYLTWLYHLWGGVSLNMIATKPIRYVGRDPGMSAPERILRTTLDLTRLRRDRREGHVPPPIPRTPEQAAQRRDG